MTLPRLTSPSTRVHLDDLVRALAARWGERYAGVLVLAAACLFVAVLALVLRVVVG